MTVLVCYWVLRVVCACECVCARACVCVCVCVCAARLCVCERERERERGGGGSHHSTSAILIAACVCVCVWERERERVTSQQSVGYSPSEIVLIASCLQTHMSIITVCHVTLFPSRAWTDGKTKDIINYLYFNFESWSLWLLKWTYISDAACGVRAITMHWVSWPIRADCACRKAGLCRK